MEPIHIWLENKKVKQLKLCNVIPELATNEDLIRFSDLIDTSPTTGFVVINFQIEKIEDHAVNYYKLEVSFSNNKLHGAYTITGYNFIYNTCYNEGVILDLDVRFYPHQLKLVIGSYEENQLVNVCWYDVIPRREPYWSVYDDFPYFPEEDSEVTIQVWTNNIREYKYLINGCSQRLTLNKRLEINEKDGILTENDYYMKTIVEWKYLNDTDTSSSYRKRYANEWLIPSKINSRVYFYHNLDSNHTIMEDHYILASLYPYLAYCDKGLEIEEDEDNLIFKKLK